LPQVKPCSKRRSGAIGSFMPAISPTCAAHAPAAARPMMPPPTITTSVRLGFANAFSRGCRLEYYRIGFGNSLFVKGKAVLSPGAVAKTNESD
jgi:hypothetical protein